MMTFIDSFSGSVTELKRGQRTPDNALLALSKDGRVSCFDRSEHRWLDKLIVDLEKLGFITEVKNTNFPWHHYELTKNGQARLAEAGKPSDHQGNGAKTK